MKVFYLGSNVYRDVLDIIKGVSNTVLVYEKMDVTQVHNIIDSLSEEGKAVCISKESILMANTSLAYGGDKREKIVSTILDDFRLFLLKTRFTKLDISGNFSSLCYFSDVIDFTLGFVEKYNPKVAYCSYIPHTVESWIFMRTLEESGTRIIRLISAPLPWMMLPVVGLSNERMELLSIGQMPDKYDKIDKYIATLKGSYDKALPYYQKIPKVSLVSSLLSKFSELSLKGIIKMYLQRLVYSEFMAVAKPVDFNHQFGIYFLHYQPEMNTLPEAGLYCDQFQAISKIASAMPKGVRLIVKEHPTTFQHNDRKWRPRGFYNRIESIPNVQVSILGIDVFKLIDNAKFVASISGVSLTEALVRGSPVVIFNTARFYHFPKEFVIDANTASVSELRISLERICSSTYRFSENKMLACLEAVARDGYDGSENDSFIPQTVLQAATNAKRANLLAIQDVINKVLV
jgi:hypothetical protein